MNLASARRESAIELAKRRGWARLTTGSGSVDFIVGRLAAGALTLLVASFVIFAMTNLLPGDVASIVLGRDATPEQIAALRETLGLNQPFFLQYWTWLTGLFTGDFGQSTVLVVQGLTDSAVADQIGIPLRNSAILAGIVFIIFIPLTVLLGTSAGARLGSKWDRGVSYSTLTIGALPEFVTATFLIAVLFTQLNLFSPVVTLAPGESPLSDPNSLVLPILTLLAMTVASGTRMVRAGMVDVMRQDYIMMSELNGFPRRRIVWRYALRNALVPCVIATAQMGGYLIGGIIVTERVFNYPGIGSLLVESVTRRDVDVVQAVAIVLATMYVLLNILADFLVHMLIPKMRTAT